MLFIKQLKEKAAYMNLSVDDHQAALMSRHWQLVNSANNKFNLTAINEQKTAIIKHYIDSLLVEPLLPQEGKVVDIGSGAGYPGIPLAIMRPSAQFLLLDSSKKRCGFLEQVKNQLELNNVSVLCSRAETMARDPHLRGTISVVIARAVSSLPVLLEYALPFLAPKGIFLAMKGPNLQEELTNSSNALSVLGAKTELIKKYILPDTEETRYVAVIRKTDYCPDKCPRRAGKPEKHPL
ncbi:MAG: 16S rRNA (guanine(527)-N(7))-methyltransferase RsmG [Bacillota bacterium]|jgi:16S rRNA (guanine527-N7)-methyltransferase